VAEVFEDRSIPLRLVELPARRIRHHVLDARYMTNCECDAIYHTQKAQHLTQKQVEEVDNTMHQHPRHASSVVGPYVDMNMSMLAAPPSRLRNRREHGAETRDSCHILQHIDVHFQRSALIVTMCAQLRKAEGVPTEPWSEEPHPMTMTGARISEDHPIRSGSLSVCALDAIFAKAIAMQKWDRDWHTHPPTIIVTHLQGDTPHTEVYVRSWRQGHRL
jgi:hypothetical protein